MKKEIFIKGMDFLQEVCPGATFSKTMMDFWYYELKDVGEDVFRKGIKEIAKTTQFYPSTNFMIEWERVTRGGATESDVALIAWNVARKAVDSVGAYKSIQFVDPFIHTAILTGWKSWPDFDKAITGDDTWVRKEFIAQYNVAVKLKQPPEKYLRGLTEIHNRSEGYDDHIDPIMRFDSLSGKVVALLNPNTLEAGVIPRLRLVDPEAQKALVDLKKDDSEKTEYMGDKIKLLTKGLGK